MTEIEVDEDFLKYDPGSPGAVERGEAKGVEYVAKNPMFRFECQHSP